MRIERERRRADKRLQIQLAAWRNSTFTILSSLLQACLVIIPLARGRPFNSYHEEDASMSLFSLSLSARHELCTPPLPKPVRKPQQ